MTTGETTTIGNMMKVITSSKIEDAA